MANQSNPPPIPVKKDRHIVSWTPQEDDLLREQIARNGTENWTRIAAQFKDKTSRQCRRRWYTYLNTECKIGGWSAEEDMLLCEAQKILGNRWTEIAKVVSGRTDNAVKNRFSTLCKKRAKLEASFKENDNSQVNSSNKRGLAQRGSATALTGDSSAPNKQIRYHISDMKENIQEHKRFLGEHKLVEGCFRQPLAPVVENFDSGGRLPDDTGKPFCDAFGKEKQNTFLKRDDPKLAALLQQSELLTSLSMKLNADNTNQNVDEHWKELQDYLTQTEEGKSLKLEFAGKDKLLDELKDYVKHLRCTSKDGQHSLRQLGSPEDSKGRDASSNHLGLMEAGQENDCLADILSINEDSEGNGLYDNEPYCSEVNAQVFVSSEKLNGNSENSCNMRDLDFASPLQTVPLFQSFTDGNPSPAFTSSERHFLVSVLDASTPETKFNFPKPSCKRVLLDSLPPS